MSAGSAMLWIAIPYATLAIFVGGLVWRRRRGGLDWTTRSTQLLERKLLRPGSLLFHLGLLAVIGGHVLGLLVPKSLTEAAGLTETAYHAVSVSAGTSAGAAMTVGFAILWYRRLRVPAVAATTTTSDRLLYPLLGIVIATGMVATVGHNLLGGGYDYRETVAPWFRGVFTLQPDPELMSGAPLVYQLHVLAALLLFALWPFSRLVHALSVPVTYLRRSPVLYRRGTRGTPYPAPAGDGAVPALGLPNASAQTEVPKEGILR
jgi:nitrate reductase gamma subunit